MKMFAGDFNLDETKEVGRKLEYAGDRLDEEFDRSENLSWDQFQKLLDALNIEVSKEDLVDEIVDYVFSNAELEVTDTEDEEDPYTRAEDRGSWEWEHEGFFFQVKGTVFGRVNYSPETRWTSSSSKTTIDGIRDVKALVFLGDQNIEAFEDREDWNEKGELEQYYDLGVDVSDDVEAAFNEEAKNL